MKPKDLRKAVPRSAHAQWKAHPERPSVVEFLKSSSEGRVPDLIPVRYYRMSLSPFAFLRGAASIMAFDLAHSSISTGPTVQLGGDAHLQNFGIFGTPERNLIFDINDFDETLPGPWEWDLKRLAASVHVSAATSGLPEKRIHDAVVAATRAYASRMRRCAALTTLEVWYSRVDAAELAGFNVPLHPHELVANEYVTETNGEVRIADKPPKLFHPTDPTETIEDTDAAFERYQTTVRDDIVVLLGRYKVVDIAVKVVGVGSVGTRCGVALLVAEENDGDRLLLQVKEANASVLEPYLGKSKYDEHGHRVVAGQRLMQTASDIFLGWTTSSDGHQYYVRQLNDLKIAIDSTKLDAARFVRYASFCGEALALSHARSSDPSAIAGYIGTSGIFEEAIARFAATYAEQNDRDYKAFIKAIKGGELPSRVG